MFALCNVIRLGMMKKYNLPNDFELSQSFLFFYDKLERGNYFLNSIIETRDQPISSRIVAHLCTNPTEDGGQFDMLVNIVQKYGICPKSVYGETKCCVASRRNESVFIEQTEELLRPSCENAVACPLPPLRTFMR